MHGIYHVNTSIHEPKAVGRRHLSMRMETDFSVLPSLLETTTAQVLTIASAEGPPSNMSPQETCGTRCTVIQTSTHPAAGQANLPLLDAGSAGLQRSLPRSTMPPFPRCSPAGGLQTELPSPPPSLLAGPHSSLLTRPHPSRFPTPRLACMQYLGMTL